MELLYYPYLRVESDSKLKQLLLLWGDVRTIVPEGMASVDLLAAREYYDSVNYEAGAEVVGFAWAGWEDIQATGDAIINDLIEWEGHGQAMRLTPSDLGRGRVFRLDVHKVAPPLREMLVKDKYAVIRDDDLVCSQKFGRHYMSILASQMHVSHNIPIINDDPGATTISVLRGGRLIQQLPTAHAVCLAVPELHVSQEAIADLSLLDVLNLRRDLHSLASDYRQEVNAYQLAIQTLALNGQEEEAWDKLAELQARILDCFNPVATEGRRLSKFLRPNASQVIVGGIAAGVTVFLTRTLARRLMEGTSVDLVADFASGIAGAGLPAMVGYAADRLPGAHGFDYLISLNRRISLRRLSRFLPTVCLTGNK